MNNNESNAGLLEIAQSTLSAELNAVGSLLERNADSFLRLVEIIQTASGKVVVTGLGKSGLVGRKIAATLASTGTTAVFLNASEALHGDLGMVSRGDIVIMLSKSAATIELSNMMPTLRRLRATLAGFFGNPNGNLVSMMDVQFDLSVNSEGCPLDLAPMASSTLALVAGDVLAAMLMHARGFEQNDFALFHPGGTLGRKLLLKAEDVMHYGDKLPRVRHTGTLGDAVLELSRTSLGAVGVVDGEDMLIGIITDGDIRRIFLKNPSLDVPVLDFMTSDFTSIRKEWQLGKVLSIMENPSKLISAVPVIDENYKYIGMVRLHDIL